MGWIKARIESEHRKYHNMQNGIDKFNLDWALIAEKKIIAELKDRGLLKEQTKEGSGDK